MYPPIALKVLKEARNEHEPFCSRFRWRLAAGCTWSARERHRERSTRLGGSGRQSVFLETGKPRGFTFRGRYSSPQRPQRVGMEGAGLGWGLIQTRSGSHRRPLGVARSSQSESAPYTASSSFPAPWPADAPPCGDARSMPQFHGTIHAAGEHCRLARVV